MANFLIKFTHEIEAESPLEAVKKAVISIMENEATIFLVKNDETKECFSVDFAEIDEDAVLPLEQSYYNTSGNESGN
jgi:hypothetical protein